MYIENGKFNENNFIPNIFDTLNYYFDNNINK